MLKNVRRHRFNYSFLFKFILVTFIFQFFCIFNASATTQVSLQWDANAESNLAGYRIYSREQGQSYDYANPTWEGTDTSCTIYGLDETKSYCFVARAFDTMGNESENSAEACQAAPATSNKMPTADAGPDQTVNQGQTVMLNGSNSTDSDDGIASYRWVQTGGPAATLSDPSVPKPTFTAPGVDQAGAALSFELTVVDHSGNQAKDACVVNVTWGNEPPQANAGPDQTVEEGSVVTLDGASSLDIDGAINAYMWTQTGGPSVTLSNPSSPRATFTAPNVGPDGASLSFNLTVTDAGKLQNSDSCVVNVSWENQPPSAVVTPDYIETDGGALVTLNGSKSTDPDDGIASYLWTQVDGDPVSLSDPTSDVTTFIAPKTDSMGKNLKFKLTVKDHGGLQATADNSVYVRQIENANNPISPDFSYMVLNNNKVVFLDHSTDTNGAIVSWFWNFGDGNTGSNASPTYRYNQNGTYMVTLTVTDTNGNKNSKSRSVTIEATTRSFIWQ